VTFAFTFLTFISGRCYLSEGIEKNHKRLVQYNQQTDRDFNPALSEHISENSPLQPSLPASLL
jgi:hypothetical protein